MADHPVKRRKKLIEVAIPLEAINAASAREKSIRHGHPSTLHLWWARRPLAAARAVIFCQMVDDPSAVPEEFPTEEAQEIERLRLFQLISELVTWENTTNEQVLNRAREEIRRSWRRCCADNADHPEVAELFNPEKLPGFHDPFAGGGALPLEAQRLGLEAYASDLNPVAVLINKAMIEIPPKFAGLPPINPEALSKKQLIEKEWKGAEGLAEDVRYYGKWMREEIQKRIGHCYPKVLVTPEMLVDRPDLAHYSNQELTVIAWIWARTVYSPNPFFSQKKTPLISTFLLSQMRGSEAYMDPCVDQGEYSINVRIGEPNNKKELNEGLKVGKGGNFRCIYSNTNIPVEYIREQGHSGNIGQSLIAIVAEGKNGRVYLSPNRLHEETAESVRPAFSIDTLLPKNPRSFSPPLYGLSSFGDLFTKRQLNMLGAFSEFIGEARQRLLSDIASAKQDSKGDNHLQASRQEEEYANSICTYLGIMVDRLADYNSTLSSWCIGGATTGTKMRNTFGRQALPMTWDFAEVNPFSSQSGSFGNSIDYTVKGISTVSTLPGQCLQRDAASQDLSNSKVVSTDPPYYDNIPYADLSDFFYVWLRRSLKDIYPELFATLSTPKAEELVANPYRLGSKAKAEVFFLEGMSKALKQVGFQATRAYPLTIYYAFKQAETQAGGHLTRTGWETFLESLVNAGFVLLGTWPIRTERSNRMVGTGTNALASSVVLVCQHKSKDVKTMSRAEFRRLLREKLPQSIHDLETANIAPVDVAQAAIGPGMAIFSSSKAVLNPDDSPMSVREALIEINLALDEYLSQDEGDLDADSRFALTFFESYGFDERPYGDAEGLAIARNLSVDGVSEAGILSSVAGKVRLYQRAQLPEDWDPTTDRRLCVWEATQHLIKRLEASGEGAAAELLLQLKNVSGHGDLAANCRALAYRLYNHCEKKKQAEEARSYNGLVIAWPELERLASSAAASSSAPRQTTLI
jgi:putative DNA methylase